MKYLLLLLCSAGLGRTQTVSITPVSGSSPEDNPLTLTLTLTPHEPICNAVTLELESSPSGYIRNPIAVFGQDNLTVHIQLDHLQQLCDGPVALTLTPLPLKSGCVAYDGLEIGTTLDVTLEDTQIPKVRFYCDDSGMPHAFVQLRADEPCEGVFVGFEPEYLFFLPHGVVSDETGHAYDKVFTFYISRYQYQKMTQFVAQSIENPPSYNFFTYNCVDWVVDLAAAGDIELPPHKNFWGVSSPYILCNDPSSTPGSLIPIELPWQPVAGPALIAALLDMSTQLTALLGSGFQQTDHPAVEAGVDQTVSLRITGNHNILDVNGVDWGDGSPRGGFQTVYTHTYREPGNYEMVVAVLTADNVLRHNLLPITVSPSRGDPTALTVDIPVGDPEYVLNPVTELSTEAVPSIVLLIDDYVHEWPNILPVDTLVTVVNLH